MVHYYIKKHENKCFNTTAISFSLQYLSSSFISGEILTEIGQQYIEQL